MKKGLSIFTLITLGIILLCSPAMAEGTDYDYLKLVNLTLNQSSATVNGVLAPLDQPAFSKNGRTLVPFRFLAESLGAEVSWDSQTSTAGLTLKDKKVKVTLGSKNATINGQAATLDVPAESIGGRTFIPLRFVSEALGAVVDYDAKSQAITVTLIDTAGWKTFNLAGNETLLYPSDWILTGDITSNLNILSPSGTNFTLYPAEADPAQLRSIQEATFTSQGYDFMTEVPIDGVDGSAAVYSKLDLQDTANSDIIVAATLEIEGQPFIMEINTKLSYMDGDMAIITKMFTDI